MGSYAKHRVDQGVVASLNRVKTRLEVVLEEYENSAKPLHHVEFNLRQAMASLKEVRKTVLHSGDY